MRLVMLALVGAVCLLAGEVDAVKPVKKASVVDSNETLVGEVIGLVGVRPFIILLVSTVVMFL